MLQVKPARTKSFRQTRKPILLVVNSRLLNLFYCVLWLACNSSGVVSVSLKELSITITSFAIETGIYCPRGDRLLLCPAAQPCCQCSQQKRPPKEVRVPSYLANRMRSITNRRVSAAVEPVEAFGHPQGRSTASEYAYRQCRQHMSLGRSRTHQLDLQRHACDKPWPSP